MKRAWEWLVKQAKELGPVIGWSCGCIGMIEALRGHWAEGAFFVAVAVLLTTRRSG